MPRVDARGCFGCVFDKVCNRIASRAAYVRIGLRTTRSANWADCIVEMSVQPRGFAQSDSVVAVVYSVVAVGVFTDKESSVWVGFGCNPVLFTVVLFMARHCS
uniref:Uncharacterized protein n=1 Tax=Oryza rufipogon TaxID=4529 RepID=A0A0E0QAP2_ORYRU